VADDNQQEAGGKREPQDRRQGGREPEMDRNSQFLEWLLDYELRSSARHRRFVSLVMATPADCQVDLTELLSDACRETDEVFACRTASAVVMGETDEGQAELAIKRLQQMCRGIDLRFALASYPKDGRMPSDLLWIAHRRLNEAKRGSAGAVVASG
jgi:hypothetical protein